MTHICVGKLTIIGSDNGLSPGRRQAIFWTNARILLIGHLGTTFSETSTRIQAFSFKKMHLKMSSAKWRLFRLGLNVLTAGRTHLGYRVHDVISSTLRTQNTTNIHINQISLPNSLMIGESYLWQWTCTKLVQMMACRQPISSYFHSRWALDNVLWKCQSFSRLQCVYNENSLFTSQMAESCFVTSISTGTDPSKVLGAFQ